MTMTYSEALNILKEFSVNLTRIANTLERDFVCNRNLEEIESCKEIHKFLNDASKDIFIANRYLDEAITNLELTKKFGEDPSMKKKKVSFTKRYNDLKKIFKEEKKSKEDNDSK